MPQPSRPIWPPTPGFYLVRLVPKGPFVGAQIAHDDTGWWSMLDGVYSDPVDDPVWLTDVEKIHAYGRMTTMAEVQFRLGLKRYQQIYNPDAPAANPRKPINIDKLVPF